MNWLRFVRQRTRLARSVLSSSRAIFCISDFPGRGLRLLNRDTSGAHGIKRLDSPLALSRISNLLFQPCHRGPNVITRRFDVVGSRRAHVSVPQDLLNHHIGHSQAVQIAPKATPGSVPSVPLGNRTVALVLMACSLVV
jgi:hypothetical protein